MGAIGVHVVLQCVLNVSLGYCRCATILGASLDALVSEAICPRAGIDCEGLRAAFVNMLPLFSTPIEVCHGEYSARANPLLSLSQVLTLVTSWFDTRAHGLAVHATPDTQVDTCVRAFVSSSFFHFRMQLFRCSGSCARGCYRRTAWRTLLLMSCRWYGEYGAFVLGIVNLRDGAVTIYPAANSAQSCRTDRVERGTRVCTGQP